MLNWKTWLIEARYLGTLPMRCLANSRREKQGTAPSMILFYHRVADDHPNAWTIPTQLFERQINWIRKRFEIVSLAEAQCRLRSKNNYVPTVSLTFDDGYSDNCAHALPFLIRHQIPCTYFITLDPVLSGRPFPHDEQAGVPLAPNTVEQIRSLADAGIEIGAHTRTHPDVGKISDPSQLHDEIVTVKDELELLTQKEVPYFAFPFGLESNMTAEAVRVVRNAGYKGICSAYGAYNLPERQDDFFHLRRIHADPEMSRLKNWLTVDARKLRITDPDCFSSENSTAAEPCAQVSLTP